MSHTDVTGTLTAEGLLLALDTVRAKWGRQGARFVGEISVPIPSEPGGQPVVCQTFVFDGVRYELFVRADKSLSVMEWTAPEQGELPRLQTIRVPRGLPFPKGFRNREGYRE